MERPLADDFELAFKLTATPQILEDVICGRTDKAALARHREHVKKTIETTLFLRGHGIDPRFLKKDGTDANGRSVETGPSGL